MNGGVKPTLPRESRTAPKRVNSNQGRMKKAASVGRRGGTILCVSAKWSGGADVVILSGVVLVEVGGDSIGFCIEMIDRHNLIPDDMKLTINRTTNALGLCSDPDAVFPIIPGG